MSSMPGTKQCSVYGGRITPAERDALIGTFDSVTAAEELTDKAAASYSYVIEVVRSEPRVASNVLPFQR